MTPQELKISILQLAIQGKLVPQCPEEGTGEELYSTIIFTDKKTLKPISDDEIPFDIPFSWKWIRHNELFEIVGGSQPPKSKFENNPKEGYVRLYQIRDYGENPVPVFVPQNLVSKFTKKGDILLARYGASVGKVFWAEDGAYNVAMAKSAPLFEEGAVLPAFVYYYYLAPLYQTLVRNNSRSAQAGFNKEDLNELLFPLPPLAEQKRIVAKIEELLPYIDRYEQAWNKLEDFNKRFPVDMQKSILQTAIQGELVPQLPEEGTGEELYQQIQAEKQRLIKEGTIKKEKPLSEITEDEIPFDIPESWKWCRLSTLGLTQTGNTPSKAHPEYTGEDIPFITPGDILDGKIQYNNQALSLLGKEVARVCCSGSIMQVCIGGSIGKAAITEREVTFNQQINVISPIACSSKYLFAVMQSAYFTTTMKEQAGGTATPIINRGLWDSLLIPLPPLAEQKRIVAKLEEILPLCERLK